MKKLILILSLFLLGSINTFAQFETVWHKKTPNLAPIQEVKFSNNSQMLLVLVPGHKSFIHDVASGELLHELPVVYQPVFSFDDNYVYGISGNHIAKLNIETGEDESIFEPMEGVEEMSFINTAMSNDQKYFLATTKTGFKIWDVETGLIINEKVFNEPTDVHTATYSQIQISCDKNEIYIYEYRKIFKGMDGNTPIYYFSQKINAYDLNSLELIRNIFSWETGEGTTVLSAFLISNTCNYVALKLGNKDSEWIEIHDLNSLELVSTMNYAEQIKFSSDDKYLLTSSPSKFLLSLYDVETGEQLINQNFGTITSLDISKDGEYIVVSGGDIFALINFSFIDVPLKKEILEIIYPNPTTNDVNIQFDLPTSGEVIITITDLKGGSQDIYQAYHHAGENTINLNLSYLQQGTYIMKLTSGDILKTYKVIKY